MDHKTKVLIARRGRTRQDLKERPRALFGTEFWMQRKKLRAIKTKKREDGMKLSAKLRRVAAKMRNEGASEAAIEREIKKLKEETE